MNKITAMDRVGVRRLLLYIRKTIMENAAKLGESGNYTWLEFGNAVHDLIQEHMAFCYERKAFLSYSITDFGPNKGNRKFSIDFRILKDTPMVTMEFSLMEGSCVLQE